MKSKDQVLISLLVLGVLFFTVDAKIVQKQPVAHAKLMPKAEAPYTPVVHNNTTLYYEKNKRTL